MKNPVPLNLRFRRAVITVRQDVAPDPTVVHCGIFWNAEEVVPPAKPVTGILGPKERTATFKKHGATFTVVAEFVGLSHCLSSL